MFHCNSNYEGRRRFYLEAAADVLCVEEVQVCECYFHVQFQEFYKHPWTGDIHIQVVVDQHCHNFQGKYH